MENTFKQFSIPQTSTCSRSSHGIFTLRKSSLLKIDGWRAQPLQNACNVWFIFVSTNLRIKNKLYRSKVLEHDVELWIFWSVLELVSETLNSTFIPGGQRKAAWLNMILIRQLAVSSMHTPKVCWTTVKVKNMEYVTMSPNQWAFRQSKMHA